MVSREDAEFVGDLLDGSRQAEAINARVLLKVLGVVLGEEGDHCGCMDCGICGNCVACGDCPCEEPDIWADGSCDRHPILCGAGDWQGGGYVCDRINGHENAWHWQTVPATSTKPQSKIKWLDQEVLTD